ncbi:MAG: hypothetical protein QOK10_1928 [Pseudonocardiales bacterium]|jgi:hypothetical protein|nr:hypothetical protein [Pseudonocardiales bacterium]
MTGDEFDHEAAAVSQRWALRMREMGYLHAAVELDDAAERLVGCGTQSTGHFDLSVDVRSESHQAVELPDVACA